MCKENSAQHHHWINRLLKEATPLLIFATSLVFLYDGIVGITLANPSSVIELGGAAVGVAAFGYLLVRYRFDSTR
ncbi:hypothetical protein HT576_12125 [Haloterrigena sp. SYSU A121-1]|uniref:Uncharacterized protein n=1 Tax=Haloterrigena gelatinilytica TaxID=2741724 RepID=A0A8J8GKM7_9EURY|nr:hypothetical protein [Haloterrigena gelatinilytica]NUB91763.1 hypothetical protein [Haloterrigena gelatinilytica]